MCSCLEATSVSLRLLGSSCLQLLKPPQEWGQAVPSECPKAYQKASLAAGHSCSAAPVWGVSRIPILPRGGDERPGGIAGR
jgi:hypothetical protein